MKLRKVLSNLFTFCIVLCLIIAWDSIHEIDFLTAVGVLIIFLISEIIRIIIKGVLKC